MAKGKKNVGALFAKMKDGEGKNGKVAAIGKGKKSSKKGC